MEETWGKEREDVRQGDGAGVQCTYMAPSTRQWEWLTVCVCAFGWESVMRAPLDEGVYAVPCDLVQPDAAIVGPSGDGLQQEGQT